MKPRPREGSPEWFNDRMRMLAYLSTEEGVKQSLQLTGRHIDLHMPGTPQVATTVVQKRGASLATLGAGALFGLGLPFLGLAAYDAFKAPAPDKVIEFEIDTRATGLGSTKTFSRTP